SPWPLTTPLPRPCHPNAIAFAAPLPRPCHVSAITCAMPLPWLRHRYQAKAVEFPKDFMGISLQEQPDMYYMIIRQQRLIMEAESSMQEIMEKLQSYKTRIAISFEGIQYRLGDFRLRVGKVSPVNSENLRGIMMEMEYLPISSWETSHQIMNEFFDILKETLGGRSLPGHFVHVEPNFSEYGLSDQYTSQHTAVQYASFMAQMISTVNDAEKGSDIDPQEAQQTLEIAEAENLMFGSVEWQ
ncbi:Mediator of RNA polymerase II transcription subunit 20a, partial [Capsicum annuum]